MVAAPTPTQTPYAGPTGSVRSAQLSPTNDRIANTPNETLGHSLVKPSDALRLSAQPASSSPERISTTHAMRTFPSRGCAGWPRPPSRTHFWYDRTKIVGPRLGA